MRRPALYSETVLITGATGDLGSSVAINFAAQGTRNFALVTSERSRPKAKKLAQTLKREFKCAVKILTADLLKVRDVKRIVQDAWRWRQFDTVVVAHGIHRVGGHLKRGTKKDAIATYLCNLFSVENVLYEVVQVRASASNRAPTRAVLITSRAGNGLSSRSGDQRYADSKYLANKLVFEHSPAYKEKGVSLIGLAPGPFVGDMTDGRNYPPSELLEPEEVSKQVWALAEQDHQTGAGRVRLFERRNGKIRKTFIKFR